MDETVVAALAQSGSKGSLPSLVIVRDDLGKIAMQSGDVQVQVGEGRQTLALRQVRELFTGERRAPDLSQGPTPALEPFFMLLEYTVLRFCEADGRDPTDQDMAAIYASLRRRPDSNGGKLHGYLRAAARLYLSVRDVSQAEYEAVFNRLAKSARTFSVPPISRNYVATLRQTFAGMSDR
jgi:hypothetical protein